MSISNREFRKIVDKLREAVLLFETRTGTSLVTRKALSRVSAFRPGGCSVLVTDFIHFFTQAFLSEHGSARVDVQFVTGGSEFLVDFTSWLTLERKEPISFQLLCNAEQIQQQHPDPSVASEVLCKALLHGLAHMALSRSACLTGEAGRRVLMSGEAEAKAHVFADVAYAFLTGECQPSRLDSVGLLYADDNPPSALVRAVTMADAEILRYLKIHPQAIYDITPRRFEEIIAEILASFGWQVDLTAKSKDGGYDIFAVSTDSRTGLSTSWVVECKKYREDRKVGVEIARALYTVKSELKAANALLATTSHFTQGVYDFKSSRYDFETEDYEGILRWINKYRPRPGGTLHLRDGA